jgi:UDP-glucose 4-epimerase
MRFLVIGHDGLLGGAVCQTLRGDGHEPRVVDVPWGTPQAAGVLCNAMTAMSTQDASPWTLMWCAGAGVTATKQPVFDEELETFTAVMDHLLAPGTGRPACLFFASSAGALYAGASGAPFTEASQVVPLAPYGRSKVALEAQASRLAEAGVAVAIGRIANLYGPGQDLRKQQGLISQLCLAVRTRRPINIYVPLDTLRDYIFAPDAGRLIVDFVHAVRAAAPGVTIKIIASGRSTSIAQLLGDLNRVSKHRPPVVVAASPKGLVQARDLRLRSTVLPEVDTHRHVPLPAGIAACLTSVEQRGARGDRVRS